VGERGKRWHRYQHLFGTQRERQDKDRLGDGGEFHNFDEDSMKSKFQMVGGCCSLSASPDSNNPGISGMVMGFP
jgi:hypothetical protein